MLFPAWAELMGGMEGDMWLSHLIAGMEYWVDFRWEGGLVWRMGSFGVGGEDACGYVGKGWVEGVVSSEMAHLFIF